MNYFTPFRFLTALLIVACLCQGWVWAADDKPLSRVERLNVAWDPSDSPPYSELQAYQGDFKAKLRQAGLFDETVMVPMRDGTRLSTMIVKPIFSLGRLPAILVRLPYGKEDYSNMALLISLSGYVVVMQDTRGRFDSEGEDRVFLDDGWGENQDGYDTVEWIAQQSWSNGKVGSWGYSALGIAGSLAAGSAPPHLVCQVSGYAASKGYGHIVYQNGVFRKSLVDGWLVKNGSAHFLPVFLEHPTLDEFWSVYDITSRHHVIDIPCLFIGGYYDCFEQGTLDDFVGRQANGAEGARGNQQLIIGPWTHVNEGKSQQGQLIYPPNSIFASVITDSLDWFDYWMKGDDNGVDRQPAVTYYVMGDTTDLEAPGNEWRTADAWPPQSQSVPFFLHPNYSLSPFTNTDSNTLTFIHQPGSSIPTLGGMNLEIDAGPYDQTPILQNNENILVFSTDTLEEPIEIVGRVKAVIYAESNLTDNDITVRLTDLYPDGRSMLLCDGIVRASFRESLENPTPIVPGEVYRYDVDLWSTSILFNRGHRIQIILANTNDPRFEINPVYGSLGLEGMPETASTLVHLSPEYPSHLLLPVTSGVPDTGIENWLLFD